MGTRNLRCSIIVIFMGLILTGCIMENTKKELVASKCRLGVPVKMADCHAAGVRTIKGGQLLGLPVGEMETGMTTQEIMIVDTESRIQFLEGSKYQKNIEDWARVTNKKL